MSYIGIFDSGLGGLSILKQLMLTFPNQQFVYLADTKNLPYGDKNINELRAICYNNLSFFSDAEIIIMACNTVSSLKEVIKTKKPTINMIDCMVESFASEINQINHVGILATSFVVQQNIYHDKLAKKYPQLSIYQQNAPLLVPAIENKSPDLISILENYLDMFPKDTEAILLGCTHYNLLIDKIQTIKPEMKIIDPYIGIQKIIKPYIKVENPKKEHVRFVTNLYTDTLHYLSEKIMNKKIIWEDFFHFLKNEKIY